MYETTSTYLQAELDYRADRHQRGLARRPPPPRRIRAGTPAGRGRRPRPLNPWSARRSRHDGCRARTHQQDPDRTRRRAGGDRLPARRPSASGRGPDGGEPRAVLLSGDAGVGKTRLLTELRDLAIERGLAGVRRTLPRLRRQRPALPPVLRGPRPAGRRPPRRRRHRRRHPPRPDPAPARPAGARPPPRRATAVGAGPGRPVRGRARPARGGRREGARPAGHRGHPLGRPVDPRHAQLPVLPALRRARSPWWRRTAPTTCTAATRSAPRSRSGPGSAASSASSSSLWQAPDVRTPHPRAAPRPAGRDRGRRHRRPRRGQRVLRRGARRRGLRPGPLGARPSSPTCSWSGSTGSTTRPGRWSGRPASPGAGSPTTC